jgi:phosphonopyruvate decarboxylase
MSGTASAFLDLLEAEGYDFFTGVPCSLFKGVTRLLDGEPRYAYLSAVREDAAVGAASGAWFGGAKPVVFMQNSGLGTSSNALVSLNLIYDIPVLLVVSWRGYQGKDAPEHLIMGDVMEQWFQMIGVPYQILDPERMEEQVREVTATAEATGKPVALLVHKGILQ